MLHKGKDKMKNLKKIIIVNGYVGEDINEGKNYIKIPTISKYNLGRFKERKVKIIYEEK